jgi:hypothetical protein
VLNYYPNQLRPQQPAVVVDLTNEANWGVTRNEALFINWYIAWGGRVGGELTR